MSLSEYIEQQIQLMPAYIYGIALIVFILGSLFFVIMKPNNIALKKISSLFLLEYIFIIYGITLIYRQPSNTTHYNITPFWSYMVKPYAHAFLLPETIVNIAMFVPIGFLASVLYKNINWLKVLLIGATISLSIEILQFVFMKGFSEFDDVFHNTLGCMIGFGIYQLVIKLKVLMK